MADRPNFEEISPQIIGCLRAGMSVASAAQECGTKEGTVKHWLTKGRQEPDGKYGNFALLADSIREEREESVGVERLDDDSAMLELEKMIRRGSPTAAKLWFERRDREAGEDAPAKPRGVLDEIDDELAERRAAHSA